VKVLSPPLVDARRAADIVRQLLARRPGYVPQWLPPDKGPGSALIWIYAHYLEAILARLNQAPQKNQLAFLEMLGIELIPAQAARTPLVFKLSNDAPSVHLPGGTQVAAPAPPESAEQIVFEIERGLGISAAVLQQVVSVWPGRDQYIDHSEAYIAGSSIQLFQRSQLRDTPHILYIAHDTLLALAGKASVNVEFELTQPGSEKLDLVWEYWDGKLWRWFKQQHPQCVATDEAKLDTTEGLTHSGKFRLETDCAETAKTTVDDVEAFWVRAVLDEPLPQDPKQILPEVSQVRVSSIVERGFSVVVKQVTTRYEEDNNTTAGQMSITLTVVDRNGIALNGVLVNLPTEAALQVTDNNGEIVVTSSNTSARPINMELSLLGVSVNSQFEYEPVTVDDVSVTVTLHVESIQPDSAFADAQALDLGGTFYPFGQQPQTGSAFYFSSEEAFSKPGARVTLYIVAARTPQDQFNVSVDATVPVVSGNGGGGSTDSATNDDDETLLFEYWDGRRWSLLSTQEPLGGEQNNGNMTVFEFVVPENLNLATVNDIEALWIRVRLVSGAFGKTHDVTWQDSQGNTNRFTYFIPQPPAVADFRMAYVWEYGPYHAEQVRSYNNFEYSDHTITAQWPGDSFQPFHQLADLTPALYLGADKALPVDRVNVYFEIQENTRSGASPALLWEYWNGVRWRALLANDETQGFCYPGIVSFIGAQDAVPLKRFGRELHWLRARLKEDAPPSQPLIDGIYLNAAWASQWQTLANETLGTGNGLAGQVVTFRRIPVLQGERIEVRELSGARANVEWRIVALDVLGDDARIIQELEDRLGQEGEQTDVEKGDLRLRRDRHKKVSEVWVRWYAQPHLLNAAPQDRHYVLERARGRVSFGDGELGRRPPLGADIIAWQYRSGGGRSGNVAAGSISQMLTGVAGIESVSNPHDAEGGADGETLDHLIRRGPRTLRHRGRGLLAADLETMAREASPAVALAQVIPTLDQQGHRRPGWVTLVIIPNTQDKQPWPSFGLREKVRRYIEAHGASTVAALRQFHVTGPDYRLVDVEASIAPMDPAQAGEVEQRARQALQVFFHPLLGGSTANGWLPGRDVYLSDVATCLERIEGVDYVREMALFIDGRLMAEKVPVQATQIVAAGETTIKLAFSNPF